ncbi:ATP10 protein-domain-containing protein [Podospora conica]|nr:ATP10 protein-domain-containing protein [Schizothecium conicum]
MILRPSCRAVTCLSRQYRPFTTSYIRLAAKKTPAPTPPSAPKPSPPPSPLDEEATPPPEGVKGPLAHAPRYYGRPHHEFTPTPLSRPIGMPTPPQVGENRGIDTRTLKQRRDDFVDYEKHLARRKKLTAVVSRPYFRDWRNMRFHKGKTFLAPPRPFKASVSLYFPNLYGRTLAGAYSDTTPLLRGRASVVTIFSSMWAQRQAESFSADPALRGVLEGSGGRAQLVQVNVEEDALKALLIRLFSWSVRRRVSKADWGRYFVLRKGLTDEIRENIGVLNGRVGYTYLVDHECRIRWAGSGHAEEAEKESLVKGLQRVLKEIEDGEVAGEPAGEPVGKPVVEPVGAPVEGKGV